MAIKKTTSLVSPVKTDKVSTILKIISKNFLTLPNISRDLNVARQSVQQLVKLEGGKPRQGADRFFLKSSERESALENEQEKIEGDIKPTPPTPVKPVTDDKGSGLFQRLKKTFAPENVLLKLGAAFSLAALLIDFQELWEDITSSFKEWASELYTDIKENFDEWIVNIKNSFSELSKTISVNVKSFINKWIVEPVKGAFKYLSDGFVGFVENINIYAEKAIGFIKGIWDKFTSVIKAAKEKWEAFKKSITATPESIKKAEEDYAGSNEFSGMDAEPEIKPKAAPKTVTPPKDVGRDAAASNSRRARKTRSLTVKPTSPAAAPAPAASATTPSVTQETKTVKISPTLGKQSVISEMDNEGITDPTARAAIMAQVGHESGGFRTLSENLNYSSKGLLGTFKKYFKTEEDAASIARQPVKIAERVYSNRMGNGPEGSGDGWKYRGRGFIQLTGKYNYKKYGYLSDPDALTKPEGAAKSAIKYMMNYKGDWGDVKSVTKFVNGGTIGLKDRMAHFQEYLNDVKITGVSKSPSGVAVAAASSTNESEKRLQSKPKTPVIVNSNSTTNVKVVNNVKSNKPVNDVSTTFAGRIV